MKSESRKFDKKESQFAVDLLNKESKKAWIFTYEIYRITSGVTQRVDIGTRRVEAVSLEKAYESMKMENHKVVITYIYEL
jgi:hypothetical protein